MLISRRALIGSAVAGLAVRRAGASAPPPVRVQRLAWAGIRLEFAASTLFLDPLTDPAIWGRALPDRLVPVHDAKGDRFVAISHAHADHANPKTICEALGDKGTLFHDRITQPALPAIRTRAMPLFEPALLTDFTLACVPAADGYGDPQVSWVVTGGGKRMIHGGDTQWHGHWWTIGRHYGPFDVAFLPVNGAKFGFRQPVSDIPAVMTPEQAVAAAIILGAKQLVPIHYGVQGADNYEETGNIIGRLRAAAKRRGVQLSVLAPGEWLDLSA